MEDERCPSSHILSPHCLLIPLANALELTHSDDTAVGAGNSTELVIAGIFSLDEAVFGFERCGVRSASLSVARDWGVVCREYRVLVNKSGERDDGRFFSIVVVVVLKVEPDEVLDRGMGVGTTMQGKSCYSSCG